MTTAFGYPEGITREVIRRVAVRYVRRCIADGAGRCRIEDLAHGCGFMGHGESVEVRGYRVFVSQADGVWLDSPARYDLHAVFREASRPERAADPVQAALF